MNISLLLITTGLLFMAAASVFGPGTDREAGRDGSEETIIDFGNTPAAAWEIVNDSVMGGVSRSAFQLHKDGYAIFSGTVSLENNGGFASVRARSRTPADLSGYQGLSVRVLGDGKTYCLRIKTVENGRLTRYSYEARFETKAGEWQTHQLPYSDFKPVFRGRDVRGNPALNTNAIAEIGFMIRDGQEGEFRLAVREVGAFQ